MDLPCSKNTAEEEIQEY